MPLKGPRTGLGNLSQRPEVRRRRSMQRLRTRGSSILGTLAGVPRLKKKALNSWSAVQDTYFSTKEIFERHKVVFTIGTSIASVATAWVGYSLRHLHESRVEQRLESIETAMESHHHLKKEEFKKLVNPGGQNVAAYMATAGTAFIIGYGFGWRGGRWFANRKFRKEQMRALGQLRPRGWQLQFLKRRMMRSRTPESAIKTSKTVLKDSPAAHNHGNLPEAS